MLPRSKAPKGALGGGPSHSHGVPILMNANRNMLPAPVILPLREQSPPRRRRAAKAKAKAVVARRQGLARERLPGLSVLQSVSVTDRTRDTYLKLYGEFRRYVGREFELLSTTTAVDQALSRFLDHVFLRGESLAGAQRILAAVMFFHPLLGRGGRGSLPKAAQSLKGFRRIDPPRARLPLPWPLIVMIFNHLWRRGEVTYALALILMFECYLRPAETFQVRAVDVVFPTAAMLRARRAAGAKGPMVDIVLNPAEEGVPSKTQEFDSTVTLDLERHAPLATALKQYLEGRLGRAWRAEQDVALANGHAAAPLFPGSAVRMLTEVKLVLRELGVNLGDTQLYRVRHSGASHDYVHQARSIEDIRRRGRWRCFQSVRRYEKGGRLGQILLQQPQWVQDHAERCAGCASDVIVGQRCALAVP